MFRNMFVFVLVFFTLGCTGLPEGITPVANFDADSYTGKWYEIARLDHSFERGLSNVTATYTFREDGGIDVLNKGFHDQDKQWEEASGKAYFVSDKTIGHLKVSFFGPFYASYVVFYLDQNNYSYSLVTGPDRDFLWVLSRTPELDPDIYDGLIKHAASLGFETEKLIKVIQNKHST